MEFETPSGNVLSVAEVSFASPFLEPKVEGNGISVEWNVIIPVIFSEMVGYVFANLVVHEFSDFRERPFVVPYMGLNDGFPWVGEVISKENGIFSGFGRESGCDTCMVNIPMGEKIFPGEVITIPL